MGSSFLQSSCRTQTYMFNISYLHIKASICLTYKIRKVCIKHKQYYNKLNIIGVWKICSRFQQCFIKKGVQTLHSTKAEFQYKLTILINAIILVVSYCEFRCIELSTANAQKKGLSRTISVPTILCFSHIIINENKLL